MLLKHSTYSSEFLNDVGGDMLTFERKNGDSGVWATNQPSGPISDGFHLDLIDGAGGFDPMVGLMKALANKPEASKEFFAGDPGTTGSRVDYLLTDRVWRPDDPSGGMIDKDAQSPGTDSLGQALDNATTGRPRDATSASIREAVVRHLGADADTRHGTVEDTNLAPPNLRDSLGHMLSIYIGDVNQFSWPHHVFDRCAACLDTDTLWTSSVGARMIDRTHGPTPADDDGPGHWTQKVAKPVAQRVFVAACKDEGAAELPARRLE